MYIMLAKNMMAEEDLVPDEQSAGYNTAVDQTKLKIEGGKDAKKADTEVVTIQDYNKNNKDIAEVLNGDEVLDPESA